MHFYQVVKSDENDKAGVVISLRYSVGDIFRCCFSLILIYLVNINWRVGCVVNVISAVLGTFPNSQLLSAFFGKHKDYNKRYLIS